MAMARGHSSLGQSSPCLITVGIQMTQTKPPKPPRQDSPVPSLPCKQTPWQPTPGASGTRWSEELFREPPIPGLSTSSKPPGDDPTREPEPEVAPMPSMEEPF
ncbi:hypothetical protein O181_114878, partial [Austropuccinia psidii MF-1]|nr:hypothetical protein [Austropuccinia psidii MF-1]